MTIHIAGHPVRVGSRGRQLCAWCGCVLIDVDQSVVAADGATVKASPWQTGELVRIEGAVSQVIPHKPGEVLPDGSCAKNGDEESVVVSRINGQC